MGRRKATELEVRVAFEASRIAPQCLADAYERLVPIPRRLTRKAAVSSPRSIPLPHRHGCGGLNVGSITAGLYARVSTDAQARGNTIASQLAALHERACADAVTIDLHHAYVDEGRSSASLARPALERLRDAVASGEVDRVYVQAPDRLARRYAYQVLLI